MFNLQKLDNSQIELCKKTISANTFYLLVGDAIISKKPLSVIRMADGECHFMRDCRNNNPKSLAKPPSGHNNTWMENMGCLGITREDLLNRLILAANKCDYFAPSITGISQNNYNMYDYPWHILNRSIYVDNFFPNIWDEEMKINLFKLAKHVLFIHKNTSTADAMQIRAKTFGVKVTYLKLTNWRESDIVANKASQIDAPLVIFSAGPANKYIGPYIAHNGIPKVTLDIGQAADRWTFLSLNHVTRSDADKIKL